MNQKIKMVFVDLDGTLLQNVDTVSPRTIEAFEQVRALGITPVIATGRLAYESDFASRAIGADSYLIAMNGLVVYEDYRAGKILYQAYMPESVVPDIIHLLQEHEVFFQAYAGNRAYCAQSHSALIHTCGMTEQQVQFFSGTQMVVPDLMAHLQEKQLKVNKLFTCIPDAEKNAKLRTLLNQIPGVKTLSSGEYFVEIVPEGADKQRAVHTVREHIGLSPEEVIVIGDSENDLGMFDEATTCVAMGNACAELKAKANYLAPENTADGVAWMLETLLLHQPQPHLNGQIETLHAKDIENSLVHSTRQYLVGDLKLPQQLDFLYDEHVEIGISQYPHYKWEQPHYHTMTSEYCYILTGETKYIDLQESVEYHFKEGDFYILHQNTSYLQKCAPGCKLLFLKVPGINDKVTLPIDSRMKKWCADWNTLW